MLGGGVGRRGDKEVIRRVAYVYGLWIHDGAAHAKSYNLQVAITQ